MHGRTTSTPTCNQTEPTERTKNDLTSGRNLEMRCYGKRFHNVEDGAVDMTVLNENGLSAVA